jgi:predicted 3-demethylubiquinone-9 3-methyltransferase (glyoxalase superfamily)
MHDITACLWFDTQAEDAARFYTSIFPNSRITSVTHYGEGGMREAGMVMVVAFELDGRPFTALNGGPQFTFSEAVSFQVMCDDQEQIDHFWDALTDGGEEGPCGWLKDRFGVSWQIVPRRLIELVTSNDGETAKRVTDSMMTMHRIVIAELEEAASAAV